MPAKKKTAAVAAAPKKTVKKSAAAKAKTETELNQSVVTEEDKPAPKTAKKAPAKKAVKAAAPVEPAAETAAPEAVEEKPAAKKAPAKKAVKAEEKPVEEVKAEEKPVEEKPAVKKAPAKKAVKAEVKTEEKPAAKAEVKAEEKPAAKAEVKAEEKPAAKAEVKAEEKPAAKAEVKAEEKPAAKAEVKAEEKPAAKAEVKAEEKPAAKAEVKAEEKPAAKADAKVEEKPAAKAEEKAPAKKAPTKKAAKAKKAEAKPVEEPVVVVEEEEVVPAKPLVDLTEEKINFYQTLNEGTLVEILKNLGIDKDLETLKSELARELDIPGYVEKLILEKTSKENELDFVEDGYDLSVIPYAVFTIYENLPFKATDNLDLATKIKRYSDLKLGNDPMYNAELYNNLFDLVREILVKGQEKNWHSIADAEKEIPVAIRPLIDNFMNVAYDLLPSWSYDDVKYYEGFLYGVLSQFEDLNDLHNRAMMDVADLYIKHGDYGRGDADYNYVIRENGLKDYIYWRFANVYRPIDLQKAKAIAGSALQYVDGRYHWYNPIMEILHS